MPRPGETGVYAVHVEGQGSFWRTLSTMATRPPLKVVYPVTGRLVRFANSRYWFQIPVGARQLRIRVKPVGSGALFSVRDPDGRPVLRATVPAAAEAGEQLVRLRVAPAQAGRLWQLEGWSSTVSLSIGTDTADVPPYLATAAKQFSVPAGPGPRRNGEWSPSPFWPLLPGTTRMPHTWRRPPSLAATAPQGPEGGAMQTTRPSASERKSRPFAAARPSHAGGASSVYCASFSPVDADAAHSIPPILPS